MSHFRRVVQDSSPHQRESTSTLSLCCSQTKASAPSSKMCSSAIHSAYASAHRGGKGRGRAGRPSKTTSRKCIQGAAKKSGKTVSAAMSWPGSGKWVEGKTSIGGQTVGPATRILQNSIHVWFRTAASCNNSQLKNGTSVSPTGLSALKTDVSPSRWSANMCLCSTNLPHQMSINKMGVKHLTNQWLSKFTILKKGKDI